MMDIVPFYNALQPYTVRFNYYLEEFEGYIGDVYFWAYFEDHRMVCFYGETFRLRIVTNINEFRSFLKEITNEV